MDQELTKQEPITMVISEVVILNRLHEYEELVDDLVHAIKEFEGYIGIDVIRPSDHHHPEYVIIIRFNSYNHLKNWQESAANQEWELKSSDLIVGEAQIQKASGIEVWFTLPDEGRFMPQPAYYNMVFVSTLAVYPLVLLSNTLLGPLLGGLPFEVELLISITVVSALMTSPVMPYLTHWFDSWLYPSAGKGK